MDKAYQPKTIEDHWSQLWIERNYSAPAGQNTPYSIMLPPPNVTGTLHMGHGFQQTLMDALIRMHRMQGDQTLWQGGTDHAGIATQMVVERQLAKEGRTRHDVGRGPFVDRVWQWSKHSGKIIMNQIRRLGASIDWSRERFSMDEWVTTATNEAFIRLYEEGLIYRGKRLVNWDPALQTAVSDLEVLSESEATHLWHLRYPIIGSDQFIIVATTRPETMLGDVAVAVHPDDPRYQALIGKKIQLPLTDREIPIIADDAVSQEFGSGCVKITPAHDFNDNEMGKRHNLPLINIFTADAALNENVPSAYRGLDRFDARKKIVADLTALNLVEKIEPYTTQIPRGDRSGVVIEPFLTDQWFVKMDGLAKPAMDAATSGKIKFVPENWQKTYQQWLENIQDWCISRQLWWGHRIPVWYDENHTIYVGQDENDVRRKYKISNKVTLTQDSDVLDTWFTAALWPFSSLGWPEKTYELQNFYPSDVMVTGFDIIFFWVARMAMFGIHLMGDIPFRTVYITGLIRDTQGQKMSKSKGNIIDPIDLIDGIDLESLVKKRTESMMQPQMQQKIAEQTRKEFPNGFAAHGTDALRFTFCSLATTGRDINFDMGRMEGYRNFCNKIWNAARYVIMNTENQEISGDAEFSLADRWIQSQLQKLTQSVHEHFSNYRFDLLAQALYEFMWNEYCDWYLELSKVILTNPESNPKQLIGTRRTLLSVLETYLRLLHPVMPFITEEIWQKVAPMLGISGESIMLAKFPTVDKTKIDKKALEEIDWLKQCVTAIRNVRSEIGVSPAKKIDLLITKSSQKDQFNLQELHEYITALARVANIQTVSKKPNETTATALVDTLEIHIPIADLIDKEAELKRLSKEIEKLEKEFEKSTKKLENPSYVDKAPADVVSKERERLKKSEQTLTQLKEHLERIMQI